MKKRTLFISCLVMLCNSAIAACPESSPEIENQDCESKSSSMQSRDTKKMPCERTIKPLLEVKAGYFFFSSSKLRKIYKKGGLDLQLSSSYPIWKWLQAYASVEYLTRSGKIRNSGKKTTIWELPVSLGLQPVVVIHPMVHYYLSIGPRYFFVHQHNDSPFLDKVLTHSGVGGFVNTGFHFFPINRLVIDIFGEYSYKKMHFHAHKTNVEGRNIQVGGFAFGGGLGYAF